LPQALSIDTSPQVEAILVTLFGELHELDGQYRKPIKLIQKVAVKPLH
jgi:hypothetical protein